MTRLQLPFLFLEPLIRNSWLNITLVIAVAIANGYASARGQVWGDWLATVLFALYAGYCAQNFLQCREVHCAITAPGFAAAAVLMLLQSVGVAHFGYGVPWVVFAVSAGIGYCFQYAYRARTGSIYLKQ
jgi:hypothetical protein